MKIGDLVKVKHSTQSRYLGIVVTTPRFGVNVMSPCGTTGEKLCEVWFPHVGRVVSRGCLDMEVVNESR